MSVLEPVDGGSVVDRVAAELRRAIQAGSCRPASRLVERALARDLRTSHIPVREALARLAEEGLVQRQPRRGARVAVLTDTRLEELASLRTVLEQFVARRVQERWSPAIERALRAARGGDGRGRRRPGDAGHVIDLDDAFHADLLRAGRPRAAAARWRRACAGASGLPARGHAAAADRRAAPRTPSRTASWSKRWPAATRGWPSARSRGTSPSRPSGSGAALLET